MGGERAQLQIVEAQYTWLDVITNCLSQVSSVGHLIDVADSYGSFMPPIVGRARENIAVLLTRVYNFSRFGCWNVLIRKRSGRIPIEKVVSYALQRRWPRDSAVISEDEYLRAVAWLYLPHGGTTVMKSLSCFTHELSLAADHVPSATFPLMQRAMYLSVTKPRNEYECRYLSMTRHPHRFDCFVDKQVFAQYEKLLKDAGTYSLSRLNIFRDACMQIAFDRAFILTSYITPEDIHASFKTIRRAILKSNIAAGRGYSLRRLTRLADVLFLEYQGLQKKGILGIRDKSLAIELVAVLVGCNAYTDQQAKAMSGMVTYASRSLEYLPGALSSEDMLILVKFAWSSIRKSLVQFRPDTPPRDGIVVTEYLSGAQWRTCSGEHMRYLECRICEGMLDYIQRRRIDISSTLSFKVVNFNDVTRILVSTDGGTS